MTVRLAVTTTRDRSAQLADGCKEHGLVPVVLPCIEIVGAPDETITSARREAESADWLFVTSSRTVDVLWPSRDMPAVEVAAVGQSTAEAVRTAGGMSVIVGDGGGHQLVERISRSIAGQSVFFPHSTGTNPTIVDALNHAGAKATVMAVYDVRPVAPGSDEVDGVIFGSPTAVTGWSLARGLDGLVVGAIGPTTAAALDDLGVRPDVTPALPSFDHLIRLMAEHLRERTTI